MKGKIMNFDFVWKIILVIVALVVINTLLAPLLTPLLPPFGTIAVIALYLGALAWVLGLLPHKN